MLNERAKILAEKISSGDEITASRVISMIENGEDIGFEVLSAIYPSTGRAFRIGITGSPGSGKSTIIDRLAISYVKIGKKVGIIAIDPTSIKSKGALFGDRLRLKSAEKVEGIFIRSMAHRGFLGGIAKAALGAECVLEALGKEIIIVESVGVGQTELSISLISDVVVTVLTPDFGDEIQLMKANLLDIGDVVVMNKMDLKGAEEKAKDLTTYLYDIKKENLPIIKTIASRGEGIEDLLSILEEKRKKGIGDDKKKLKELVLAFLREELMGNLERLIEEDPQFDELLKKVEKRNLDPYSLAKTILTSFFKNGRAEECIWKKK